MSQSLTPEPGRRGPRRLVLLVVAAVALGGAGWSIWSSVGDEAIHALADYRQARALAANPPRPVAPSPPVDQPIADDDETAIWSELAIFHAGAGRPRPVVVVRRARQTARDSGNDGVSRGSLAREVVRQGIILAARSGFDVVVRDQAIGDPDEVGPSDATYRVGSLFQAKKRASAEHPAGGRIAIVAGAGADRKVVWHRTLDCMGMEYPDYARLVGLVKLLADQEFRALMAGWQLPPTPAPRSPARPDALPDGAEPRLGSLAETDQYAALRAIHAMIRADGGSPTRWQALARGYAMLGSLTESLLGAEHAVFKARSLLYAQVAIDATKESAASLCDQAFAEGLAGMDPAARSDLDLAAKNDPGRAPTPRAEALRAYLAADPDALGRLAARDPADLLPLYLKGIARSRLSGRAGGDDRTCRNETVAALDEVLARVPDCHRAVAEMCRGSGVNNSHRATMIDLGSFAATSARRVAAVPGLPAAVAVAARLDDGGGVDEFALRQALSKAATDDPNELSWGVLAQLLRDIRFVQVAQRLYFLGTLLGAGAADFVEEARPLVADHPLHDLVELYAETLDRDAQVALVARLDFGDVEIKDYHLLQSIIDLFQGGTSPIWVQSLERADWGLAPNLERIARHQSLPAARATWSRGLLAVDPRSPVARALLVEANWDRYAPEVAAWEGEQPWNTALFAAHGLQLVKLKRYAEAEPPLEAAMQRSPEGWLFRGLAEAYREQGRVDRWVEAAEAMLRQPTQGLDQAVVANDLAGYFMDQGDADRAWPWAERAAQSGAAWAVATALRCAEMRRDGADAEGRVARLSQRYAANWLDWLVWCVRNDQGNRDEAARLVWAQWDANRRVGSPDQGLLLTSLALILDRPDIARQVAEVQLAADPRSTADTLHLALAADRLGDARARDAALDRIVGEANPSAPRTARILGILIDGFRHPAAAALDLARVDALLGEIPADRRPMSDTMVGLFLDQFGPKDQAVRYLKRGDAPLNWLGSRLIARQALHARGEPLANFATVRPATADSNSNSNVATP